MEAMNIVSKHHINIDTREFEICEYLFFCDRGEYSSVFPHIAKGEAFQKYKKRERKKDGKWYEKRRKEKNEKEEREN